MSNLKVVKFNAAMSCSGCAGAITRILSKIDGVEKVEPFVDNKMVDVTVRNDVDAKILLDALLKWSLSSGKAVSLIEPEVV